MYQKILGGLIGAAAGDAMGAATETRTRKQIEDRVGGEVRDLTSEGSLIGQTRLISVYSLADNQYQMPFALT